MLTAARIVPPGAEILLPPAAAAVMHDESRARRPRPRMENRHDLHFN